MQSLATCGVRFPQPNSLADGLDRFGANTNGKSGRVFVNLAKDLRYLPSCVAERRGPFSRIKVFAQEKINSEDGREVSIQSDSVSLHKDQGPMVTVKFVLEKKCKFGQQFHVVGDAPQFGSWDPKAAVPLEWSEGDLWTKDVVHIPGLTATAFCHCNLRCEPLWMVLNIKFTENKSSSHPEYSCTIRHHQDVPVGKQIEYKFILIGKRGELLWQPGPNQAFETSGSVASVVVSSKWELDEKIASEAGNEKEVCEATEMEITEKEVCEATEMEITEQGIGNENSVATLVEEIFSNVISGVDAEQTGNVSSDPPNGVFGSSVKQTEDNTQRKDSDVDLSGPPDAPGCKTERNEE